MILVNTILKISLPLKAFLKIVDVYFDNILYNKKMIFEIITQRITSNKSFI